MHALLCRPRSSNGAYVYMSVNRKVWGGYHPVSLYLYRDPKTGELIWIIGGTRHGKPEDVNDPRNSASKDNAYALFDSSPSAKGGCALNGPAAPACKWRECRSHYGKCFAYPRTTSPNLGESNRGRKPTTTGYCPWCLSSWYNASGSLKVVVGGKGGH